MLVDTLVDVFATPDETGATPGAAEEAEATRLRGARILLTEDNEINQQIAVELLEGAGATVQVANNGREAVETTHGLAPPLSTWSSWTSRCPRWTATRPRRKFAPTRGLPTCRSSP